MVNCPSSSVMVLKKKAESDLQLCAPAVSSFHNEGCYCTTSYAADAVSHDLSYEHLSTKAAAVQHVGTPGVVLQIQCLASCIAI